MFLNELSVLVSIFKGPKPQRPSYTTLILKIDSIRVRSEKNYIRVIRQQCINCLIFYYIIITKIYQIFYNFLLHGSLGSPCTKHENILQYNKQKRQLYWAGPEHANLFFFVSDSNPVKSSESEIRKVSSRQRG